MSISNEWTSTSMPYVAPLAGGAEAWATEAASHGQRGTQTLAHAGEVAAPQRIAEALGIEGGDTVVVRRRVILADGAPVELADSYYPASIASGTPLAEPHKIKGGAVRLVAELGYATARVREDVTARMPSEGERAMLQMPTGEPVVVLERLSSTADGQPIQADIMITPASLRRLRYELKVAE
jgi:DNA-binding GntR family transcriptional regulator